MVRKTFCDVCDKLVGTIEVDIWGMEENMSKHFCTVQHAHAYLHKLLKLRRRKL